jgi:RNA recognition motif-containing protein
MTAKIFVGNLSWNATEEALRELFAQFGEVISVRIVTDPYTGRSKGFGFVEMTDEAACSAAIEKLDNYNFINRPLRVSRARQEGAGGGGSGRPPRSGGDRERRPGGGGMRGAHSGPRSGGGRSHSHYDEEN